MFYLFRILAYRYSLIMSSLGLPYLQKQNSGQCMANFHETKYIRYHILSRRNLTYKIGIATHKKLLLVTLHSSEIAYPGNTTTNCHAKTLNFRVKNINEN